MKGTAGSIHSPCERQGKKNGRFIFLLKHAFKSGKYLNGGGSFQPEDLTFPLTREGGGTDIQEGSH